MRFPLLLVVIVGGCSTPAVRTPSLAPRAAEAIDPRVPVRPEPMIGAPAAALAARLAELVGAARASDAAFAPAADHAEQLAASAGAPHSEGWIVAQQALSVAVAARRDAARALGDIDALGADALEQRGGLSPGDLAAIEAAADEAGAIERRQAARVEAIQRRLGG
ncbi:hypothetical protein [Sphingomonas sp.]|uniref:hypothetical protein n=1 Tax=Sphingomonas sp. TaxID=28214 RepID=UPI00286E170A|nr:hypothetical protein [Sphingomonas sp.]